MKKIILFAISLAFFTLCKAQDEIIADANASVRSVSSTFNKIRISSAIKVIITQYETESLAVSAAEEKDKEEIKTVIENSVLKIYFSGNSNWRSKDRQLKVYVSFKNISLIEVSGASDVVGIGKIKLKELAINVSGASTIKGQFYTDKLELNMSGASKAKLYGMATLLSVKCSGASDVEAYNLESSVCNANASGASDMEINVAKEINAVASGASNIKYKGEAVIKNVKASGAASISRRE